MTPSDDERVEYLAEFWERDLEDAKTDPESDPDAMQDIRDTAAALRQFVAVRQSLRTKAKTCTICEGIGKVIGHLGESWDMCPACQGAGRWVSLNVAMRAAGMS